MTRLALPNDAEKPRLSREFVEKYASERWLNLGDTSKIVTANPFASRTRFEVENPHVHLLSLMRRPENFGFTVKILFGKTLAPFQLAILKELWLRPFPMLIGARGAGKSWILALYAMLRGLFNQGSKIVIVGAAFRQAKVEFDYCQELWESGPVFRDLVGESRRNGPRRDVDRCYLKIGDSLITALPLGDGTKIRGQRANVVIGTEFASIPKDVFETVVRGFAAVSFGPVDQYIREMKKVALKELGVFAGEAADDGSALLTNQTIVSGTAYYAFNHFYEYWKRYKAIVESRGDPKKVAEVFGGAVPDDFNWKDYSVIRIPVDALPPRFMDAKQIAHARATAHVGIFQMEYGAVFPADSNGFYRRSLIERCVVGRPGRPVEHPSSGEVRFRASLRGTPGAAYVMGIDPASQDDNFSIVIVECWPEHRRVVFCWTSTKTRFDAQRKRGLTDAPTFYAYCARKIRELMRLFGVERIAIDSQGGGHAICEALNDPANMPEGSLFLHPLIDPDKPKESDALAGRHLLDVVNFAQGEWVSLANHGMRKDFEDRALLFPEFDPAVLALSHEDDKEAGRVKVDQRDLSVEKLYDTLEDCVLEIEELKDELATIVHTQTGTSLRDRWDTPEVKLPGGKKGRLRKDRYSSLLMANMAGRTIQRAPREAEYRPSGGFARDLVSGKGREAAAGLWATGPAWYTDSVGHAGGYGAVVRRGV